MEQTCVMQRMTLVVSPLLCENMQQTETSLENVHHPPFTLLGVVHTPLTLQVAGFPHTCRLCQLTILSSYTLSEQHLA